MSKLGSAYCANNVAVRLNSSRVGQQAVVGQSHVTAAALMAIGIMIEIDCAVAVKRNV